MCLSNITRIYVRFSSIDKLQTYYKLTLPHKSLAQTESNKQLKHSLHCTLHLRLKNKHKIALNKDENFTTIEMIDLWLNIKLH